METFVALIAVTCIAGLITGVAMRMAARQWPTREDLADDSDWLDDALRNGLPSPRARRWEP